MQSYYVVCRISSLLVLIGILLLIHPYAEGQCPIVDRCQDVGDSSTFTAISNDLSDQLSELAYHSVEVCYDSTDIVSLTPFGYQGVGIMTWFKVELPQASEILYIVPRSPRDEVRPLLRVFSGSECNGNELYNSMNDKSPAVLTMAVSATLGSCSVRAVIPLEQASRTAGAIEFRVYSIKSMPDCQVNRELDVNGGNNSIEAIITSRELQDFGTAFVAGEAVTLEGHLPLHLISSKPKAIIPIIGDGWDDTNVDWEAAFDISVADVVYVAQDDFCPIRSGVDLPFYCTYMVDGHIRLCNMALQDCPCSEPVEAGDPLPRGFVMPLGDLCNADLGCSPSSYTSTISVPLTCEFEVELKVATDPFRRDMSVTYLMLDHGTIGCAEESCHKNISSIVLGRRTKVADETPRYYIVADERTYCSGQPIEVVINIGNSEYDSLSLQVEADDRMVDELSIYSGPDTSLIVTLPGYTVVSGEIELTLRPLEQDAIVLDRAHILVDVPLQATVQIEGDCLEDCFDILVTTSIGLPAGTTFTWSDGSLRGDFRNYCKSQGPLGLVVDAGVCGIDSVIFDVNPTDLPLEIITPDYVCSFFATDANEIKIRGLAELALSYNLDLVSEDGLLNFSKLNDTTFLPGLAGPSEVGEYRFNVELYDDSGCSSYLTEATIPNYYGRRLPRHVGCLFGAQMSDHSYIRYDSFAAEIPDDANISQVDYQCNTVIGLSNEDLDAKIEVSSANVGTHNVEAYASSSDGCTFLFVTQLVIVQKEEIAFDVTDFEVDFSIPNVVTMDGILWEFGDGTTSTDIFPSHIYNQPGNYTVTARISTPCGVYVASTVVDIYNVSTEQQIGEPALSIYPNPATNQVTVQAPNLKRIKLHPIDGKVVKVANVRSENKGVATFDVAGYAAGLYILEAITERGSRFYQKLVIQ